MPIDPITFRPDEDIESYFESGLPTVLAVLLALCFIAAGGLIIAAILTA